MAMIGNKINLGFDAKGSLVISDKKLRMGVKPFTSSSDVELSAPLNGIVTARVTVPLFAGIDLTIPPEQVKVVLSTQAVSSATLCAIRDLLNKQEAS